MVFLWFSYGFHHLGDCKGKQWAVTVNVFLPFGKQAWQWNDQRVPPQH